jgi:hypothetical protein
VPLASLDNALAGGDVAVAQQHPYHSQIGAMVEQAGGEGVTQGVGRKLAADPGEAHVALDEVPEGLAGHGRTARRGEQRMAGVPPQ